jgi:hypothetical protein
MSISTLVVEHLSKTKETDPPENGRVDAGSTTSTSDVRPFDWPYLLAISAGEQIFLRMSSCKESTPEGFEQFKCFHCPSDASPSLFFCRNYYKV